MKTIHILPTDKPSRLVLDVNKNLSLAFNKSIEESAKHKKNIYITSDEEIKEGDYIIHNGKLYKVSKNKGLYLSVYELSSLDIRTDLCKKIILTTDQDLIKDGVQGIDDEFLEWFVKNPSCESVKIESLNIGNSKVGYVICKPQEEPKQSTVGKEFYESADEIITIHKQDIIQLIEDRILSEYKKHSLSLPDEWAKIAYKIYKSISKSPSYKKSPIKLTKMEETLEQYIERLKDRRTEDDYPYTDEDFIDYMEHIEDSHKNNLSVYKCLEFMYFAERKSEQVKDITYWKNNAEEDLREAFGQGWMTRERFDDLSPEIVYPDGLDYEEKQEYAFNLWFNQFKKK
jgi:hypothetical protein